MPLLTGTRRSLLATPQWLPASLANLAGWWKADAGITIATGVSQWDDQSGNGRNMAQATTTMQPVFSSSSGPNGLPGITGDGVNDFLGVDFTLGDPFTIYLLMKQTTWVAGDAFCAGLAANTALVRAALLGATPQIEGYNAASGSFVGPNGNLALATWGVVCFVMAGSGAGASSIRVNNTAPVTGTGGATDPNGFYLFATPAGLVASDCTITEAIVRSAADDTATQNLHVNYLARRGGLAI